MSESVPKCVVAIDFGTSGTGFAFAFRDEVFEAKEIICKEPGGQEAQKAPTVLLLDKLGKFKAFGAKALDYYYGADDGFVVCQYGENGDMLFEKFKMLLNGPDARTCKALSLNGVPFFHLKSYQFLIFYTGRELAIIDVISECLVYVKSQAITEINKSRLSDVNERDIQWVLTVPAIWTDIAKAAMRQAAMKAGLVNSDDLQRLQLVLEPEAACIACQYESASLRKDDSFMVLDCGGGTVDVTMHTVKEMRPELLLDELAPPSGGPFGSTYVDLEFEQFLLDLVGDVAFHQFKPSAEWVQLMRTWEGIKLGFGRLGEESSSSTPINIGPILESVGTSTLGDLVATYNARHPDKCVGSRGKSTLILPGAVLQGFFDPVVNKIIKHVHELLRVSEVKAVKYIFLVGGFAESKVLLHRVRSEFECDKLRVVVPRRPGLAVLRGAVQLGLGAASQFASRIARFTYGVALSRQYDPDTYPDHQGRNISIQMVDGSPVTYVKDTFSVIVSKGTSVQLDELHQSEPIHAISDDQRQVRFELFCTPKNNAKWTNDEGMYPLGSVTLPAKRKQELSLDLKFGSTEIWVEAVNKATGEKRPAVIDFKF